MQEILGHSSVKLTLDTYSHVLPGMQESAVEQIDALLNKFGDATRAASLLDGNQRVRPAVERKLGKWLIPI